MGVVLDTMGELEDPLPADLRARHSFPVWRRRFSRSTGRAITPT